MTVPVVDLFNKELEIIRDKELILIPTTCGTGSEVTNISILELTAIQSKFGLAVDELYADFAVLLPELLDELPMSVLPPVQLMRLSRPSIPMGASKNLTPCWQKF